MKKYRCTICGYIYDEAKEGIKFADLPDDWKCPLCGAPKNLFEEVITDEEQNDSDATEDPVINESAENEDLRELTPAEIAYICSNLAKGAEKEYKFAEQELFNELYKHYENSVIAENGSLLDIENLFAKDKKLIDNSYKIAEKYNDSGSKRILTWAGKTTSIIKSILENYANAGLDYLKNTKIWVCDICGFVYIGDNPPAVCPVCKVPSLKILEVE